LALETEGQMRAPRVTSSLDRIWLSPKRRNPVPCGQHPARASDTPAPSRTDHPLARLQGRRADAASVLAITSEQVAELPNRNVKRQLPGAPLDSFAPTHWNAMLLDQQPASRQCTREQYTSGTLSIRQDPPRAMQDRPRCRFVIRLRKNTVLECVRHMCPLCSRIEPQQVADISQ
jgi:hypothetical protein